VDVNSIQDFLEASPILAESGSYSFGICTKSGLRKQASGDMVDWWWGTVQHSRPTNPYQYQN
jgi:hypothetical protein